MVIVFLFSWFSGSYSYAGHTKKEKIELLYDSFLVTGRGQEVYVNQCAGCHGIDLQGQTGWQIRDKDGFLPAPPHDETGHTWHHSDTLLFSMTKYGIQHLAGESYKSRMPAYQGVLSDGEIIAVLSYIKSKWPAGLIENHNRRND